MYPPGEDYPYVIVYTLLKKEKIENHQKTDVINIYRNRTMEPKAKHLHKKLVSTMAFHFQDSLSYNTKPPGVK